MVTDDVAQPAGAVEFRRQPYWCGHVFEHDRQLGQIGPWPSSNDSESTAAVAWTIALKVQTAVEQLLAVRSNRMRIQVLSAFPRLCLRPWSVARQPKRQGNNNSDDAI
jgi:hypothetical protein